MKVAQANCHSTAEQSSHCHSDMLRSRKLSLPICQISFDKVFQEKHNFCSCIFPETKSLFFKTFYYPLTTAFRAYSQEPRCLAIVEVIAKSRVNAVAKRLLFYGVGRVVRRPPAQ